VIVNTVLRIVEVNACGIECQPFAAARVGGEELS
jgi:hypothetical protein